LRFRVGKEVYDEGALRAAYPGYIIDRFNQKVLAKQPLVTTEAANRTTRNILYGDVLAQSTARHFAALFSKKCPEYPVQFLRTELAQRCDQPGKWYVIEVFMPGVFRKHTNNASFLGKDSEVAQAFTHFTFHVSGGRMMVTDVQGVECTMTDPQIHSRDKCFGVGNRGEEGMALFFAKHQCNSICHRLKLRPHPLQFERKYLAGSVKDWPGHVGDADKVSKPPCRDAANQAIDVHHNLNGSHGFQWVGEEKANFQFRICTFSEEIFSRDTTDTACEVPSLPRDTQFTAWLRSFRHGVPSKPVSRTFSTYSPADAGNPLLLCDGCAEFLRAKDAYRGELDAAGVFCGDCEKLRQAAMKTIPCQECGERWTYSEYEVAQLRLQVPLACNICQRGMV